jgi:hypothetical protein
VSTKSQLFLWCRAAVRFFIHGSLRLQVTPERFVAYIERQGMVDWNRFKQGILLYPHYQFGNKPGVLGFIEARNEDEAQAILAQSPLSLLLAFDIEPVTPHRAF